MILSAPSAETVFAYLEKAYPDTLVLVWSFLGVIADQDFGHNPPF